MNQILTTLQQVIFEIFGDMFFIFPERYDPEENVPFPDNWIKYRINISNGKRFYLNFYFAPQQASLMAENFLGETVAELTPEMIAETIKEAVNVMGGNLLNRMDGDNQLGIPEACPTEGAMVLKQKFDSQTDVLLEVEGFPFLAVIEEE